MKKSTRRIMLIAALALAGAAVVDGYRLMAARNANRLINSQDEISSEDARPNVAFAAAWRIGQQGEYVRALTLYKRIAQKTQGASPEVQLAARYNSANLHFREALRLRSTGGNTAEQQSMPLLELAKQAYRDVLREDPQHWDARYNLERALRLAPEGEDADEPLLPPPPSKERAVTTMRGFTLGLP